MNMQQNSRKNSRRNSRRNQDEIEYDETRIDLVIPTEPNRPTAPTSFDVTGPELTATISCPQTGTNHLTPTDLQTTTRLVYDTAAKHFMNSVRLQPMVFSCAVDCFLEIWHAVVGDFFDEFSRSNSVLINLLSEMCMSYDELILVILINFSP